MPTQNTGSIQKKNQVFWCEEAQFGALEGYRVLPSMGIFKDEAYSTQDDVQIQC
jgi:hypothetical protein